MKTALPASLGALIALWPICLWVMDLNTKIMSAAEAQTLHSRRIEYVEKLTNSEFRQAREFLESVDRRLSRIEGKLSIERRK